MLSPQEKWEQFIPWQLELLGIIEGAFQARGITLGGSISLEEMENLKMSSDGPTIKAYESRAQSPKMAITAQEAKKIKKEQRCVPTALKPVITARRDRKDEHVKLKRKAKREEKRKKDLEGKQKRKENREACGHAIHKRTSLKNKLFSPVPKPRLKPIFIQIDTRSLQVSYFHPKFV